jgi:thiol-disulfide isomerase/thioredoxin
VTKFHWIWVKPIAALTLAAALIWGPVVTLGQQAAKTGSPAPHFKLKDLSGKEFTSSQFEGSVVVLDVWATWCEACIDEIPMFNRLHQKYAGSRFNVVGIAVQSGWPEDVERHVAKLGIKYPVLVGNDEVAQQYVPAGFPTTYLIGDDGKIVKTYVGTFPDSESAKERDLEREIDKLLQAR